MKRFVIGLMLLLVGMTSMAQNTTDVVQQFNWLDLVLDNWVAISSIILYVIYRLVPTKQADMIKAVIDWIWNLIPDNKKGGGKH